MRVGVVSSSQGLPFAQLCRGVEHLGVSFTVITDRPCGIEDVARERQIPCQRIEGDRTTFSRGAAQALAAQSVDLVLLYFNRLVGPELYERLPTFNIHPSLLPAFPGLSALEEAIERGVRFVGATLHLATGLVDGGPIVGQVSAPVWLPCSATELAELSFVQRVYLSLLCIELASENALDVIPARGIARHVARRPYSARCNPALQDERMLALVRELETERALDVSGLGERA